MCEFESQSTNFEARLRRRDLSLFSVISESTEGDRVSLLLVQDVIRSYFPHYVYLEVGSHLGGMLVPHLHDPLCRAAISIDKRPTTMPDVRGEELVYNENSTERMIEVLRSDPARLDIGKLITIDSDVKNVPASKIVSSPNLVMIDGEHTTAAVVSDFLSLLRFSGRDTVFLFHDSNIVFDALLTIEKFLDYLEFPHKLVFLYDNVGAVLLGKSRQIIDTLSTRSWDREVFLRAAQDYLAGRVADAHIKKRVE